MNIKFIEYDGIKGYSRVMYNDVKDVDKYKIEVWYDGKDIKALLEYLFEQENKIDKAIEYIKNCSGIYKNAINEEKEMVSSKIILEILEGEENE